MTDESAASKSAFWKEPARRVPRIALMGEFSAGKSTLANLMIGANPLPVQVVATQLPPVWMTYGTAPSVIVDLQGGETPCDINTMDGMSPEETAFIKFSCEEEILARCDIIDMPGISDPNMSSLVWERILPFADAVVWCTPATQAWRQSEAAVWAGIDENIRKNSILVVTRSDMLITERDRNKVHRRILAETDGLFADVVMMSLTKAQNVDQDDTLWVESGADTFVSTFMDMVSKIAGQLEGSPGETGARTASPANTSQVVPRRPVSRKSHAQQVLPAENQTPDPASYMPKFS